MAHVAGRGAILAPPSPRRLLLPRARVVGAARVADNDALRSAQRRARRYAVRVPSPNALRAPLGAVHIAHVLADGRWAGCPSHPPVRVAGASPAPTAPNSTELDAPASLALCCVRPLGGYCCGARCRRRRGRRRARGRAAGSPPPTSPPPSLPPRAEAAAAISSAELGDPGGAYTRRPAASAARRSAAARSTAAIAAAIGRRDRRRDRPPRSAAAIGRRAIGCILNSIVYYGLSPTISPPRLRPLHAISSAAPVAKKFSSGASLGGVMPSVSRPFGILRRASSAASPSSSDSVSPPDVSVFCGYSGYSSRSPAWPAVGSLLHLLHPVERAPAIGRDVSSSRLKLAGYPMQPSSHHPWRRQAEPPSSEAALPPAHRSTSGTRFQSRRSLARPLSRCWAHTRPQVPSNPDAQSVERCIARTRRRPPSRRSRTSRSRGQGRAEAGGRRRAGGGAITFMYSSPAGTALCDEDEVDREEQEKPLGSSPTKRKHKMSLRSSPRVAAPPTPPAPRAGRRVRRRRQPQREHADQRQRQRGPQRAAPPLLTQGAVGAAERARGKSVKNQASHTRAHAVARRTTHPRSARRHAHARGARRPPAAKAAGGEGGRGAAAVPREPYGRCVRLLPKQEHRVDVRRGGVGASGAPGAGGASPVAPPPPPIASPPRRTCRRPQRACRGAGGVVGEERRY